MNERSIVVVVDEEDNEDKEEMNACSRGVLMIQTEVYAFFNNHWKEIIFVIYIGLIAGYFVYFAFAIVRTFELDKEPSMRLLVCTLLGVFILMTHIFFKLFGSQTNTFYYRHIKPCCKSHGGRRFKIFISW